MLNGSLDTPAMPAPAVGARALARRAFFRLLRLSGIPLLLRELCQRRKVTILCYHDPKPDVADVHFRILKRLYNVISLADYLTFRRTGRALPPKALIVTLDDGHKGNFALKHVLRSHRVPATVFLCSAIVNTHRRYWWYVHGNHAEMVRLTRVSDATRLARLAEYGFSEERAYEDRTSLSSEEIASLREVVDFQSHTRFHPLLPRCTSARVEREIVQSKAELEQQFGFPVYAFAYPNGDYSPREIEVVRSVGYTCAVTLDAGFNDAHTDMFRLRRLRINDDASPDEVVVKASGLWGWIEKIVPLRRYGYMHEPAHESDSR